jgi:DNA-binding transcriptional ArsR family regulator
MTTALDDSKQWAAVAEPTRMRVLDRLLGGGEETATSLARELPLTRQAMAKHLAVLERAGLVESRREGRELRFSIRPEQLDAAARSMAEVAAAWDRRLHAIKRIAESAARDQANQEHDSQEAR